MPAHEPENPAETNDYGNPTMTRHQAKVEGQVEQAIARGEFDDLPGMGKPLPAMDQRDPDWWVKNWIEREDVELAPPVPIQLRAEGAAMRETVRREWREERVRSIVEDFNKRVLAERLRPEVGRHVYVPTIDVDAAVEQWREDRPRPAATAGGDADERGERPPGPLARWRSRRGR